MRSQKLEGVVIKRINFGEADRFIILLTENKGKVKLLGKGIRRIKSRRASHLEIFSHIKLLTHQSRSANYITEVLLVSDFRVIRSNFRRVAISYHLCEILDKILPEKETNPDIYQNFLKILHQLNSERSPEIIRKEVRVFVESLLRILGYLPPEKKLSYSQLLFEVENIIEKPLSSLHLLTRIANLGSNLD